MDGLYQSIARARMMHIKVIRNVERTCLSRRDKRQRCEPENAEIQSFFIGTSSELRKRKALRADFCDGCHMLFVFLNAKSESRNSFADWHQSIRLAQVLATFAKS